MAFLSVTCGSQCPSYPITRLGVWDESTLLCLKIRFLNKVGGTGAFIVGKGGRGEGGWRQTTQLLKEM